MLYICFMRLLIVSATEAEIRPYLKEIAESGNGTDVLITGVGVPATTYRLTRALMQGRYDLAINAGIAGSFDRKLPLGTVVQVVSDGFADLGAEDGADFLDLFRLGLAEPDTHPFTGGRLENRFRAEGLQEAQGITVNTVHGREESIRACQARFPAVTESMEGAAFFYVCLNENIPCLQIRALSNYVERRSRANWNIPLAVSALNHSLIDLVRGYTNENLIR